MTRIASSEKELRNTLNNSLRVQCLKIKLYLKHDNELIQLEQVIAYILPQYWKPPFSCVFTDREPIYGIWTAADQQVLERVEDSTVVQPLLTKDDSQAIHTSVASKKTSYVTSPINQDGLVRRQRDDQL